MLDINLLRNHLNEVTDNLALRGAALDVKKIQQLESKRKKLQIDVQELQNARNTKSKQIGKLKAQGEDVSAVLEEVNGLGDTLQEKKQQLANVQLELHAIYLEIPNLLHSDIPAGRTEEDNLEINKVGTIRDFDFQPLDHVDVGEKLGLDFDASSKISGARFMVLKHYLAKLHRAISQFMLDVQTEQHGYIECNVPFIVKKSSLEGTGQLPKMKEDLFELNDEREFFLIPTAEVPLTNLVREKTLNNSELPIKITAHTPCFRSEAGSYGKDTRGLIRQHQFEKIELVQIVHPDKSYQALEELCSHAEVILQKLELPYRKMLLCAGDIGHCSAKTYDLEVWLPGQNCYREISSCSNFEAYHSRRMKTRFKDPATKKTDFVHTINGSGLAVGRTLVAILENYQNQDGSVNIPKVLQPYMGGKKSIS